MSPFIYPFPCIYPPAALSSDTSAFDQLSSHALVRIIPGQASFEEGVESMLEMLLSAPDHTDTDDANFPIYAIRLNDTTPPVVAPSEAERTDAVSKPTLLSLIIGDKNKPMKVCLLCSANILSLTTLSQKLVERLENGQQKVHVLDATFNIENGISVAYYSAAAEENESERASRWMPYNKAVGRAKL